jgi:Cdc6-like AAA superfamily ATPase
MLKEAQVHESQHDINRRKAAVDERASSILGMDIKKVRDVAHEIAATVRRSGALPPAIVVCGGAGSGKTTLAGELSKELEIPTINLDDYLHGGFTKDEELYDERLQRALYDAWEDMPVDGWVLEHVEASNQKIVELIRPTFALHVHPGEEHLLRAAGARNLASGEGDSFREWRAMDSKEKSEKNFNKLEGRVIGRGKTWTLKLLRG